MDASAIAMIGAGCAMLMAGSVVLGFWMRFENRTTLAEATAATAAKDVEDAKELAANAHNRVTLLAAEFGMYRESVAREYIHRTTMREVEDRLTQAIDRLGDRLDRVLDRDREHKQN
jgi:hypothetical protein